MVPTLTLDSWKICQAHAWYREGVCPACVASGKGQRRQYTNSGLNSLSCSSDTSLGLLICVIYPSPERLHIEFSKQRQNQGMYLQYITAKQCGRRPGFRALWAEGLIAEFHSLNTRCLVMNASCRDVCCAKYLA